MNLIELYYEYQDEIEEMALFDTDHATSILRSCVSTLYTSNWDKAPEGLGLYDILY